MLGSNPGQLRLRHCLSDAYISSTLGCISSTLGYISSTLGYISSTLGYISSNSYGLYTRTPHLNTVRDWRCRVLFRVVFSSAEWFGTEFLEFYFCSTERNSELFSFPLKGFGRELWEFASIFGPRNGIPSCLLFHGRVRNGIPRISVPRNSWNSVGNNHLFRLFRLPRNNFFVGNSQPYACLLSSKKTMICPSFVHK
jgi:hypothetical protein